MKSLLVVLLLAACLVHLNECFYHTGGKRSIRKDVKNADKDILAAIAKDLRRRKFKEVARDRSELEDF